MSTLKNAYNAGREAALARFKLAEAPTHPVVKQTLAKDPPTQFAPPPTSPAQVASTFNMQEQTKTRLEPVKKLSAELCTTCRKDKHYGPCLKPNRTRPDGVPQKSADFNMSMHGDDPTCGDQPSTSTSYHAATSADSSLARARGGRPAGEQASSAFADLYRHLGISSAPDEAMNTTNALNKVGYSPGMGEHSTPENRGPSVNPYEQMRTFLSPPIGFGDEGTQRIRRAFDQIDNAAGATSIENGSGAPSGEPAALG